MSDAVRPISALCAPIRATYFFLAVLAVFLAVFFAVFLAVFLAADFVFAAFFAMLSS